MSEVVSSAGTRERVVTATLELFRRQGYNGTSLKDITRVSGATTGSIYHFFPGGKDALTAEVLRESGHGYGEFVELIVRSASDPVAGLADAFAGAAQLLVDTDFIDPCPIGAVAREVANTNDELRQIAAEVIADWQRRFVGILVEVGAEESAARRLAALVVASIEGGFVMARASRSVEAFSAVGAEVVDAVARAVEL
ncbi:MAG: TetR/AcrR family transcriptional regulator [Actinomycetota bacterium]